MNDQSRVTLRSLAAVWVLLLVGCQASDVREDGLTPANDGVPGESNEFIEGISSGGRWIAALEDSDDPRAVLIKDVETDAEYEIGGDAQVTLERLVWLDEDELEIHGGGDSLILRILPPEPDIQGNPPRFAVLPPEFRSPPRASSFQTFDNAAAGGAGNGSLTLGNIQYMKQRLKRDSRISRGPRVPRDP